jgi:ABC-type nitrate/sulfonate/bicarbonate transport system ATPase subunit
MITVTDLNKTFEADTGAVFEDVSFSLAAGETMAVIGPSGCGKTTLLYVLAGLLKPTSGCVNIGDKKEGAAAGRAAFILQDFGLFPWKTVTENVGLGLVLRKAAPEDIKATTAPILTELDIADLAGRYPVQLSGGQKQRVAIGRALATDPAILLMDEPFSSLDAISRERLQDIMLSMWRRRGLTYIIVTHSVEEAVFLGQRIMVLGSQPTKIKTIIANDTFGRTAVRTDQDYFAQIKKVRKIMEI